MKVKLGHIYVHCKQNQKVKVVSKRAHILLITKKFVKGHITVNEFNSGIQITYKDFKENYVPSVGNILKYL